MLSGTGFLSAMVRVRGDWFFSPVRFQNKEFERLIWTLKLVPLL